MLVRWLMRMFRGPSPPLPAGPTCSRRGGLRARSDRPMGGGWSAAARCRSPIAPGDYQAFEQLLVAIQAAWSAHDLNRCARC